MPDPKPRKLKLKNITADPTIQPRKLKLNQGVVDDYAEAMANGDEFPPLRVWKSAGGTLWLACGFHRYHAAIKAGLTEFPCLLFTGERRAAALDAIGGNLVHGLRRTRDDVREAIRIALVEAHDLSDSQVAEAVGTTDKTVATVRREMVAGSEIPNLTERTGKDGKTYPAKQVSSPQEDAGDAAEPDAEPDAPASADGGQTDDDAEPAGGGESTGELAAGESAPAGQPLPLRDDEGNYLYPLDGEGDPDAPPADANWRLPDGSVERPGDLKVSPPDVMDDPAARVDRLRDRFKTLLKLLRTAGAELGELLTHHQAGRYLRRVTDDRGSSLFVERPRIIRSGKHEGGWHSPELSRLYDAVKQAAVDRLCVGCRGGGCDHCDGAGFFPAAADGAV